MTGCRCTGHVATNCDVLAIARFIEKYKQNMDSESKDDLKQAWLSRWRKTGGKIRKKPRQVLCAYTDLLDLTLNEVDDQFCWDCWPNVTNVPPTHKSGHASTTTETTNIPALQQPPSEPPPFDAPLATLPNFTRAPQGSILDFEHHPTYVSP